MTRPLMVSAPGSLMLLGEHAVLHGHPCLVAAIDRRVRVSISPRNDGMVTIASALGDYEGDRDDLPDHSSFRFAIGALRHLPDALPGGMDALIEADMPPTIGFGTSAAVTAAMVAALDMSMHGKLSLDDSFTHAQTVIRQVQGRGSGADAAASIYGGIVYFQMGDTPRVVIDHMAQPITALYCGYKTPTPVVINHVIDAWAGRESECAALYKKMEVAVNQGRAALMSGDHSAFGKTLNAGNDLMRELGVSTPELDICVDLLRNQADIYGAKISGSGMGDCVVGWGKAKPSFSLFEQFDSVTAREGIRIE